MLQSPLTKAKSDTRAGRLGSCSTTRTASAKDTTIKLAAESRSCPRPHVTGHCFSAEDQYAFAKDNPANSYTPNTMSQLWVYTGNGNADVVFEAGEWKTASSNTSVDVVHNAPQSALAYLGSKGTLATFNTTGSHLSVLGAVMLSEDSDKQLMIAFSLDGSTPSLSIPSSSTQNGTAYTIYSSPRLSNDTHTLQLMALEIDESAFTDLQEVHVYYVTPDYQGSIHTNAVNGSDELDANPTTGSSGKSFVPVAAIVGGSVGGTVLLVATILAVYFFLIKPRRNSRPYIYYSANLDDIDSEKPSIIPEPTPFILPKLESQPTSASRSLSSPPSTIISSQTFENAAEAHIVPYAPSRHFSYTSTASVPSSVHLSVVNADEETALNTGPPGLQQPLTSAQRKAREAGVLQPPPEVQQHSDSGLRFASGSGVAGPSNIPQDLPPMYSKA